MPILSSQDLSQQETSNTNIYTFSVNVNINFNYIQEHVNDNCCEYEIPCTARCDEKIPRKEDVHASHYKVN